MRVGECIGLKRVSICMSNRCRALLVSVIGVVRSRGGGMGERRVKRKGIDDDGEMKISVSRSFSSTAPSFLLSK